MDAVILFACGVWKMSRKGGGTLQDQMSRLEQKMDAGRIAKARNWVHEDPDAVRYAFKALRSEKGRSLAKRDLKHYNEIAEIDPRVAEIWKARYFG